jgi:hypothetical protein
MRKCLKCGHVSTTLPDPPECPSCGAVYAKVEAAMTSRTGGRSSQLPASAAPRATRSLDGAGPYLAQLRAHSAYRTFRVVIGIAFWAFAVSVAVLAGVGWRQAEGWMSAVPIVTAIVAVILAVCARQAALMLADIGDATVRAAELAEREPSTQ